MCLPKKRKKFIKRLSQAAVAGVAGAVVGATLCPYISDHPTVSGEQWVIAACAVIGAVSGFFDLFARDEEK
jgi:hypothetical protein